MLPNAWNFITKLLAKARTLGWEQAKLTSRPVLAHRPQAKWFVISRIGLLAGIFHLCHSLFLTDQDPSLVQSLSIRLRSPLVW
jgi:hypothetical protein